MKKNSELNFHRSSTLRFNQKGNKLTQVNHMLMTVLVVIKMFVMNNDDFCLYNEFEIEDK